MIYFIQSMELTDRSAVTGEARGHFHEHGPIKIGFTDDYNLSNRLDSLQTGNPYHLRVVGVIADGTADAESAIHRKFADKRLCGEWFRYSLVLRKFINNNATGYAWGNAQNNRVRRPDWLLRALLRC